jgi:hypothetical protein
MSPIISARGGLSSRGYGQFNLTATPYVLAGNYDALSTVTVPSGGVSSITFAGIPTTGYTHLQIRALVRTNRTGTAGDSIVVRFNSDTGSNYSNHQLNSDGATVSAYGASGSTSWNYVERAASNGMTSGIFGAVVIDILDYANTNKYKTGRELGGVDANGSGIINLASGGWRSTSAINAISLAAGAGTGFIEYSQFALYGVKA